MHMILMLLLLSACEQGGQNEAGTSVDLKLGQALEGSWNLVNISGGFAGIDQDIEAGEVLWTFDRQLSMLTIEKRQEPEAPFGGLPSGAYSYSLLPMDGKLYLIVDGAEEGEIFLQEGQLVLDGNSRSEGSGADLFVFIFQR